MKWIVAAGLLLLTHLPGVKAEDQPLLLYRESFTEAHVSGLLPLNASRFEIGDLARGAGRGAVISLGKDRDAYGNAGFYTDFLALPGKSYLIRAEILIPQKTGITSDPKLVLWDGGWKTLRAGVRLSSLLREEWQSLSIRYTHGGSEVLMLRAGLHNQFAASCAGESCHYLVRQFEMIEEGEKPAPVSATQTASRLIAFEDDFRGKDKGSVETLRFLASSYGIYIAHSGVSTPSLNRYLHDLNPDLRVFLYHNAESLYLSSLPAGFVKENHDDWFLRDNAGEYVEEAKYKGNRIVDVTNPAFRQWLAERLSEKAASGGFDGIFLDMVCAYLYPAYYSGRGLVSPLNGKINSEMWREGFRALIRQLKERAAVPVAGNGIGFYNGAQFTEAHDEVLSLASELDGVMIEEFAVNREKGKMVPKTGGLWENDRRFFEELLRLKKEVWVMSPAGSDPEFSTEDARRYFAGSFFVLEDGNSRLALRREFLAEEDAAALEILSARQGENPEPAVRRRGKICRRGTETEVCVDPEAGTVSGGEKRP